MDPGSPRSGDAQPSVAPILRFDRADDGRLSNKKPMGGVPVVATPFGSCYLAGKSGQATARGRPTRPFGGKIVLWRSLKGAISLQADRLTFNRRLGLGRGTWGVTVPNDLTCQPGDSCIHG